MAPPPEPPPPAVDPAEQERLLHSIESGALDNAELLRLAVEGQTTRIRQAAATAIHDPGLWSELLPRLRGRDKAAYKLIKQRHDTLLAEQRATTQANSEADALCASIEKHATRPHDPLYAPTLVALTTRWQELPDHVDVGIRQRGQQAIERCREVIAAHEREVERLAAARAADEARARALEAEREAEQQAAAAQAAAAQSVAAQAEAEQAATVQPDADPAAAHEASGDPADAETSAPAEAQSTAAAQAQAEIVSLIRLSGAALKRGDTRKAARFRQSLELLLPDASTLPTHLQRNTCRRRRSARNAGGTHPRAAPGMADDQQGARGRRQRRVGTLRTGFPEGLPALPGLLHRTGRDPSRQPRRAPPGARTRAELRGRSPAGRIRRTTRLPADHARAARSAAGVAQPCAGRA